MLEGMTWSVDACGRALTETEAEATRRAVARVNMIRSC